MNYTPIQMKIIRENKRLGQITPDSIVCRKNTSNKNHDIVEYIIEGPYDLDYGRLFLGRVIKGMKDGKPVFEAFGEARGSLRRSEQYYVGSFTKKKDAIAALADYASDFHRPDSLDREFENVTEGGIPIVFIRRVNSGIVACAGSSRMSWSHSGVVDMFSGEPEKRKLYNLVKRSDFKPRFP